MSDEAEGLFDNAEEGVEEQPRGADDATEVEHEEDTAPAIPREFGGVDVSWMPEVDREVLSRQDPEVATAMAALAAKQKKAADADYTRKNQAVLDMQKELKARLDAAEFGETIRSNPVMMARLMALEGTDNGAAKPKQPRTIIEILSDPDLDPRAAQEEIDAYIAHKTGNVAETAEEAARRVLQSTPSYRKERLRDAAVAFRRSLAEPVSDEVWNMVTSEWVKAKGDRVLDADPQAMVDDLSMLIGIARTGSAAKTTTRTPRAGSALPTTPGPSVQTKKKSPLDRLREEKGKLSDDDIWKHGGTGVTGEEMERLFAEKEGRAHAQ